ncbi:hypothetical protein EV121DRAFT_291810 [Schizophyllum commune]
MDSFAPLPALEDLLLDTCAVPLSADEESSLDAMLSSSQSSWSSSQSSWSSSSKSDGATSSTVPSDAERHGSGNMTYFCVVAPPSRDWQAPDAHARVPHGFNALPSPTTTGFDALPRRTSTPYHPRLQGPPVSSPHISSTSHITTHPTLPRFLLPALSSGPTWLDRVAKSVADRSNVGVKVSRRNAK